MIASLAMVCFSDKYNTQHLIGFGICFVLLCVIGLAYKTTTLQHLRPFFLLCSLVYFGFAMGGCPCILSYFQVFILFVAGKGSFWISSILIIAIILLSVIFGAIWCGWLCWLGALQEFIFQQNKINILKTKKAQKILFCIQAVAFVALVIWIILSQRPVLCNYDPFISVFRLKIFNWTGYFTVPLLLLSSLFIYRPFCRLLCPIGFLLYLVKYLPFAKKMKIVGCTDCKRCHSYCKMNALQDKEVGKNCIMCGECKKAKCKALQG